MIKTKKQMFLVIGVFVLVLFLEATTYAFFSYSRTGSNNTVSTGRINFLATESGQITLTNATPITSTEAATDTTNAKTMTVTITGDTDYSQGLEYVVTFADANVTTTLGNTIPIALEVTPSSGLGTAETGNFYTAHTSYSTANKYKLVYDGTIANGSRILVGYIAPNTTVGTSNNTSGTITIKAYVDADQILISDTYNNGNTPTDDKATPASMGTNKTVITQNEWNTASLSFKVNVEAREGKWLTAS